MRVLKDVHQAEGKLFQGKFRNVERNEEQKTDKYVGKPGQYWLQKTTVIMLCGAKNTEIIKIHENDGK